MTVTEPTAAGYVTAHPDACAPVPYTSSVNFSAGQTVPNHVISGVSQNDGTCSFYDGSLEVFNAVGDVHVIADVFGYFTGDGYADHTLG